MNRLQSFLKRKFVRDTLILQISKVGVTASSLASSLIIVKLMSLEQYGVWGLIVSLYGIWQFLNITGIVPSATTLMSEAVGANDQPTLLQVMQIYWRVTVWFCVGGAALFGLASPLLVRWFYADAPHIVYWAGVMTLVYPTQLIFALVGITLTSRRLMRWWAFYQYFDQFTLAILMIVAVWVHPSASALVMARLAHGTVTVVVGLMLYQRLRHATAFSFPALREITQGSMSVSVVGYRRFGVLNALDKNIAQLFTTLPVQLVGTLSGTEAAGMLTFALNLIRQTTFFTSALFENLQAVIPLAIGRGEYLKLWRNLLRVMLTLLIGSAGFYVAFALAVPYLMRWLGSEWVGAERVILWLSVFGIVSTVGGVLGPLYRAFDVMEAITLSKVVTILIGGLVGWVLIPRYGALGGAWMVNGMFIFSVSSTALLTFPPLYQRAYSPPPSN